MATRVEAEPGHVEAHVASRWVKCSRVESVGSLRERAVRLSGDDMSSREGASYTGSSVWLFQKALNAVRMTPILLEHLAIDLSYRPNWMAFYENIPKTEYSEILAGNACLDGCKWDERVSYGTAIAIALTSTGRQSAESIQGAPTVTSESSPTLWTRRRCAVSNTGDGTCRTGFGVQSRQEAYIRHDVFVSIAAGEWLGLESCNYLSFCINVDQLTFVGIYTCSGFDH